MEGSLPEASSRGRTDRCPAKRPYSEKGEWGSKNLVGGNILAFPANLRRNSGAPLRSVSLREPKEQASQSCSRGLDMGVQGLQRKATLALKHYTLGQEREAATLFTLRW